MTPTDPPPRTVTVRLREVGPELDCHFVPAFTHVVEGFRPADGWADAYFRVDPPALVEAGRRYVFDVLKEEGDG